MQPPGHPTQDSSHLILRCLSTDSWRRSLFGKSFSLQPLVQVLESGQSSGASWSSAMPSSLGWGKVTITEQISVRLRRATKQLKEFSI